MGAKTKKRNKRKFIESQRRKSNMRGKNRINLNHGNETDKQLNEDNNFVNKSKSTSEQKLVGSPLTVLDLHNHSLRTSRLRQRNLESQHGSQTTVESKEEAMPTYKEWVAIQSASAAEANVTYTESGIPVTLESKDASQPSSSKDWLANQSISADEAKGVPTEPKKENPSDKPTIEVNVAPPSSFREWIAAQIASKSVNPVSPETSDSEFVAPSDSQAPPETSASEFIEPSTSIPSVSVFLPEPEISHVVIKQECDLLEDDVLPSHPASEPMDTLIVDFGDTLENETTTLNKETVDVPNYLKVKNTRKSTRVREKFENKSLQSTRLTKKASTKSKQIPKFPSGSKKLRKQFLSPQKRGRPRKYIKQDASTTTADLIILETVGTSTEDIVKVDPERSEAEELELFYKLCDKFLDETSSATAKLTASSRTCDWSSNHY